MRRRNGLAHFDRVGLRDSSDARSHLKQDQISEFANADRIFIATDSDEPGRKSAHQLAETFGKRARVVPPLPNAKM